MISARARLRGAHAKTTLFALSLCLVAMTLVPTARANGIEEGRGGDVAKDWRPPPMPTPGPFAELDITPQQVKALEETWGVRLLGVRLALSDYMLDFRFHVIDADKALPLFDTQIKPYVLVERSNIKLPVPSAAKIGSFRTTNRGKNITSGRNYYMMFGNPDRHVQSGERITIVIGDFRVERLLVN